MTKYNLNSYPKEVVFTILYKKFKNYFYNLHKKKTRKISSDLDKLKQYFYESYYKNYSKLERYNNCNKLNYLNKVIKLLNFLYVLTLIEYYHKYQLSINYKLNIDNYGLQFLNKLVSPDFNQLVHQSMNSSIRIPNKFALFVIEERMYSNLLGRNVYILGPKKTLVNLNLSTFDTLIILKPTLNDLIELGKVNLLEKKLVISFNTFNSFVLKLSNITDLLCHEIIVMFDYYAIKEFRDIKKWIKSNSNFNIRIIIQRKDIIYNKITFSPFKLQRVLISLINTDISEIYLDGFDLYSSKTYYRKSYKDETIQYCSNWVMMDLISNFILLSSLIHTFGSRIRLSEELKQVMNMKYSEYGSILEEHHKFI